MDLDKIIIVVEGLYPDGTKLTDLLCHIANCGWLGYGLDRLKAELKVAKNWKISKLLMPLLHGFDKTMAEHEASSRLGMTKDRPLGGCAGLGATIKQRTCARSQRASSQARADAAWVSWM